MKVLKGHFVLIITVFVNCLVVAQSLPDTASLVKTCNYCQHKEHKGENPYSVNFNNELPYFGTTLGLLGTGLWIKSVNEKDPFTEAELAMLDASKVNRFDRGAIYNNSSSARRISDIIRTTGLALPLVFVSNHHTKKDMLPLSVMALEVFGLTGALTLNTKFLFTRTRPLAYNPNVSLDLRTGPTTRLSFISGHTAYTAAFSVYMAKVIHDYHPNMKKGVRLGVWSFALTMPIATGYFRIKGGKHYNTDVIAGYAAGALIGWLIPELHKKGRDQKYTLAPFNNDGASGLTFMLKL